MIFSNISPYNIYIEDRFSGFLYLRENQTNNKLVFPYLENEISLNRLEFGFELSKAIKYLKRKKYFEKQYVFHSEVWSSELLEIENIKYIITKEKYVSKYKNLVPNKILFGENKLYKNLSINEFYSGDMDNNINSFSKIISFRNFKLTYNKLNIFLSEYNHNISESFLIYNNNLSEIPRFYLNRILSEYFKIEELWIDKNLSILKLIEVL